MAGFFGFFDYTKPGKGVRKDEPEKTGFALYFDIFFRRFWKIVSLNILYIIASIPAILIAFLMSDFFVGTAMVYATAGGKIDAVAHLFSLLFMSVMVLQMTGSGPASVAMNYVLRKYVNDTHAWVWSDFIDNIKRNFKQGMGVYIINVLVLFVCMFGLLFYTFVMKGMLAFFLRMLLIVFLTVFLVMQKYTYMLVSGFETKFKSIYINAFILAIVGLKQNVFSAIVILAIAYGLYQLTIWNIMVGLLVVVLLYYSVVTFTQLFITNNVVKKYVLDPMAKQTEQQKEEPFEPDFEDNVE